MMNPEIKDRWLTALRSGKYPQGEGKLRDKGRYCCWGVLCHILSKECDAAYEDLMEDQNMPSVAVYDYCELNVDDRSIEYGGETEELWRLNDVYHLDFNQIADIIEEQM